MTVSLLLNALTRSVAKEELFALDDCFVRPAKALLERCSLDEAVSRLHPIGAAILKPEATLTRKLKLGITLLEEAGAQIMFAAPVTFSGELIRQEWCYQLNKATSERVDAMDMVLQAAPALYLLFVIPSGELPAAVAFGNIKGPSNPHARTPDQLRARISSVQDPLVNFIHSPDEPADLIRQWGVLLDPATRARLLAAVFAGRADAGPEARELAERLCSAAPLVDFDLTGALDHIAASCAANPRSELRSRVLDLVERLRAGQRGSWPTLRTDLARLRIDVPFAHTLTVATLTPVMHRPGVAATLEGDVMPLWAEKRPAVLSIDRSRG